MSQYYPQILTGHTRKGRNDVLKGALFLGSIVLFIVTLYIFSNHAHSNYVNSSVACYIGDADNCPILGL